MAPNYLLSYARVDDFGPGDQGRLPAVPAAAGDVRSHCTHVRRSSSSSGPGGRGESGGEHYGQLSRRPQSAGRHWNTGEQRDGLEGCRGRRRRDRRWPCSVPVRGARRSPCTSLAPGTRRCCGAAMRRRWRPSQRARRNTRYLPAAPFPGRRCSVEADLVTAVRAADELLIAVPSHGFRECLTQVAPLLRAGHARGLGHQGIRTRDRQAAAPGRERSARPLRAARRCCPDRRLRAKSALACRRR